MAATRQDRCMLRTCDLQLLRAIIPAEMGISRTAKQQVLPCLVAHMVKDVHLTCVKSSGPRLYRY